MRQMEEMSLYLMKNRAPGVCSHVPAEALRNSVPLLL